MKAAVYRSYGPPEVIRIEEVPPPVLGADDEERVLIHVHSGSINAYDIFFRKGYYPVRPSRGLLKPRDPFLGGDVAGTVAAVGSKVDRFKPGDQVFGGCYAGHAEIARGPQRALALMPRNATFSQAAAVPTAGLTALQALRDVARVKPGQHVLVYGASGGIGHFAVQLAKYYETEVTAVCSTSNLQWVSELGADHMIDYTREDFAANGRKYDLILDAVGKRTFFNSRRALTKTGVYITEQILYPKYHGLQILLGSLLGDRRAKIHLTRTNSQDLDYLRERIEAGQLKPVIEKIYPLERIAEAHRHVENGHTRGKVVVEIRKEG